MVNPMKMRKFFLVSMCFMLIVILFGCVKSLICGAIRCQIKSGQRITFFIASDPHHISRKVHDDGKAFNNFLNTGDGKLLNYTGEIMDAFTREIKNINPDILIITGDLTTNGERDSHLEFAQKLKTIEELGTRVFVIPGNHDIENPWARTYFGEEITKIDSITRDDFLKIYAPYGYKDALSRDTDSLSYLATPSEDIWLLMLDSAKYKRNKVRDSPEMGGEISKKTLGWIEECGNLAKENNARIMAVMHHSLIDHSRLINQDYTIENNREVKDVLKNCGIDLILTGHIHIQDIKYCEKNNKTIYDIATSCLIAYPNQYGILNFIPDKGYDYYTNRVNVEAWARENNIRDKNLIDFKEYTRNFFKRRSYDKYYDSLLEISKYSDDEMMAISKTVSTVNLDYFGGFRNDLLHYIFTTDGFDLLLDSAPNFIRNYVLSMFNDQKTDNNKLFIPISLNQKD